MSIHSFPRCSGYLKAMNIRPDMTCEARGCKEDDSRF